MYSGWIVILLIQCLMCYVYFDLHTYFDAAHGYAH